MRIRSLCGKWDVAFGINDTKRQYDTQMSVPGNWKEESLFQEHTGAVWYRRYFSLTEKEAGKHLELRFGGVFRRAEVWLNKERLLEHDGYQAAFRVDLTGRAVSGENLLEVRVDCERPKDGVDNSPLFEISPLPIAGIYEPVTLESTEKICICGLYAPVDMSDGKVHVLLTARNDKDISVETVLCFHVYHGDEEVYREEQDRLLVPGKSEISLTMPLDRFELWSPETPELYDIEATLIADGATDTFRIRTGFKHLEARGREFWLNGNPYYLLGYGDDFVYPMGIPAGKDKSFFYKGIKRAKDYGFNYVRHHSHLPFEAYLDAADELGILIQPELGLANAAREQLNEENKQCFLEEWSELIREYRHHPSIAVWCGGNEMEWGFPFDKELYDIGKQLDPYRLVASTDGNYMACDANDSMDFVSICPAEYTDYLPWRELSDMFLRDDSGRPQVVHEMGNYTTVPDIRDLPKYAAAKVFPKKMERLAKLVRETGKEELYEKVHKGALSLQKLCHKLNIEKARLSSLFCGYHVWTLTDYYETTQGLLNAFYEDKAFTAEEFSGFNRQEVLLWDTERVVFSASEEVEIIIRFSRFGAEDALDGKLTLTLSDGQSQCIMKHFEGHGILEAGRFRLTMPAPELEKEYLLTASYDCGKREICNSWTLFVCPQVKINTEKEIYIHYLSRHLLEDTQVPLRHFTIPQPIGEDQIIVTEFVYDSMLDAVERGTSMLLLAREDTFKHTVRENSFKTPWWDHGRIWYLNHTNNEQMCGIVEQHPALGMLPYHGSWKLDLFGAVEQAPAVNLDALGLNVDVMLYGVDTNLNRYGYLFEFKLGNGRVLVCTLNHSRADMSDPAMVYLIKNLVNYTMSEEFRPDCRLSREEFCEALQ